MPDLPQKPDFASIEAKAGQSANRRSIVLAIIGNLVYSWSNNESMFIYVIMLLMNTDEAAATVVFATLNTTRARLDLVERLAKIKITDKALGKTLARIVTRFNALTKIRNEFNHCLYTLNERGEITDTQSIKLQEIHGQLQLTMDRKMDDARIDEMMEAIRNLTKLNRDLWDFLPRLKDHLDTMQASGKRADIEPASAKLVIS